MTDALPDPRLLRKEIDDTLELRVTPRKRLKSEGIVTLGDLIAKSPWDLLEIRNFGHVSLREVQTELAKKGLHLKHDEVALQNYRRIITEQEK
jgi:DNA-directed RNA polymerase subunit alpha